MAKLPLATWLDDCQFYLGYYSLLFTCYTELPLDSFANASSPVIIRLESGSAPFPRMILTFRPNRSFLGRSRDIKSNRLYIKRIKSSQKITHPSRLVCTEQLLWHFRSIGMINVRNPSFISRRSETSCRPGGTVSSIAWCTPPSLFSS